MNEQRIGVISDTHGLMRPEALEALQDSHRIIHAGDIGKPEVLEALQDIAPVVAVRGNIDRGSWGQHFPISQVVEWEGPASTLFMIFRSWLSIRSRQGFRL